MPAVLHGRTCLARLVVLAALGASLQAKAQERFDLTVSNIMRGPEVYGREPMNPRFTPNGEWVYFQWLPAGAPWNAPLKWYRTRGTGYEEVSRAHADSVAPLLANGPLSPDRTQRAVSVAGDLWLVSLGTNSARRLTNTPAVAETNPTFSSDGQRVFFVRDGSTVMALDLSAASITQLTDIRPGPPPPVPARVTGQRAALEADQRQLFEAVRERALADSLGKVQRDSASALNLKTTYLLPNERVTQLSASPSGRAAIVITTFAAQDAKQTIVPNYVTLTGYTEDIVVRTKVGDTSGGARVGLVEYPSGKVTWLKLHPSDSSRTAVTASSLGWNASGSTALLFVEQTDFKARYIQTVDAATAAVNTIDTLRDSAWVGGPCFGCGGFLPRSDRVWFVSEADGYAHLYVMGASGADKRQLTKGAWEVLDVNVSADGRSFELHTSEVSAFERHFYRLSVDGGTMERLTTTTGGHTATLSPDGRRMADVASRANMPPELFLGPSDRGATLTRITTSPTAAWSSFRWLTPEIVMIPASDGAKVPARIYRPRDLGAKPNGAAVIFVHGAGYMHNVHNYWSSYSREYQFNHLLASLGYVVLDIDYRASAGYGRDWRTAIYRWMGGRDLADQVDGSQYLQQQFGVQPERIGIYGGSYGGFMTLMALFNAPKSFGAGAALRSVTDWAHYNHGYTARILNQPQNDTLAYRRSSPIFFAERLEDPLLMAHGMVDVNVHFQDIVRLTERFIELGKKNWELAVYPVEDHGFVRPDSWTDEYQRILDLFERTIGRRGSKR